MRVIGLLTRALLWVVVLGIPLAGMWLASSMAALLNGPVWLTMLGGALLFPILPMAWDGFATWRKRRRAARRRSSSSFLNDLSSTRSAMSVSFVDRLMLRTLVLNILFLGVLLGRTPATAANALTARGDWILDGVEASWVEDARAVIFTIADHTDRLAKEENTWSDLGESPPPPPSPEELAAPPAKETVLIPVIPDGATGRITGTDLTVEDGVPLPLSPGDYEMIAMLADGRGIACPIEADWSGWQSDAPALGLVAGDPWYLGPEPCQQFQSPDPAWRPTLHLVRVRMTSDSHPDALPHNPVGGEPEWLLLEEALIGPDGITAVQIREPYVRLSLTEDASQGLCAATESRYIRYLAAVAEGEVRYVTPVYEALCGDVVSLPMTAAVAQRGGVSQADSVTGQVGGARSHWQQHSTPHPIVSSIPPELEGSVQLVGRYFKAQIDDPYERTRAVHDYVATRVAYDVVSLQPGQRAPQDADTVFQSGKGVCAGYANLMVALGDAAELDIVYLVGNSRDEEGGVAGSMHAWNAVKLEGKWFLIDATWDAGSVGDGGFTADYKTDYLLTPPEIFRVTHLPEVEDWQLTSPPLSRGEFTRLPMLRPSFYAADLDLVDIDRSQITVHGALDFRIRNPDGVHLDVEIKTESGQQRECQVTAGPTASVRCDFPGPGTYTVLLFHSDTPQGDYQFDGRILVNVPG